MENNNSSLTSIVQFSNYINSNFKHFPIRVLEGIRTFLGYSKVCYTILNLNPAGEVYVSDIMGLAFSEERLNAYKEYYYQFDPFIEKIQQDIKSLTSEYPKNVWYSRDFASEETFFNSEYCQHMSETGMQYQAVLTGRKYREFPAHVVSIFKSGEDGNFTDEELNILNMAGNIFISALTHYLKETDYNLKLTAWKHCGDLRKCGVCIFTNLMPPDETPLFTTYKSLLFPKQTSRDILWSLTDGHDPMVVLQQHTPLTLYRIHNATRYQIKLVKDAASISTDKYISSYIIMEIFPEVEQYESAISSGMVFRHNPALKTYAFTDRELDVLQLLQKGYSNQQISDTLYMSIPTVKTHVGNIFKKLGVSSRAATISKLSTILQSAN